MTENEERKAVVEEALTWIGTPYHANADVKGAGVDCGMLLVRVFVDLELVPYFDPRPYPAQWNLNQRAERYMEWVKKWAREVPGPIEGRPVLPGDIILFHYGLCYAHGAIVVEWPIAIHALGPGKVQRVNVLVDSFIRNLDHKFFTIWPREAA